MLANVVIYVYYLVGAAAVVSEEYGFSNKSCKKFQVLMK